MPSRRPSSYKTNPLISTLTKNPGRDPTVSNANEPSRASLERQFLTKTRFGNTPAKASTDQQLSSLVLNTQLANHDARSKIHTTLSESPSSTKQIQRWPMPTHRDSQNHSQQARPPCSPLQNPINQPIKPNSLPSKPSQNPPNTPWPKTTKPTTEQARPPPNPHPSHNPNLTPNPNTPNLNHSPRKPIQQPTSHPSAPPIQPPSHRHRAFTQQSPHLHLLIPHLFPPFPSLSLLLTSSPKYPPIHLTPPP